MKLKPKATEVDRQVGSRLRERRRLLGLTMEQLGQRVGVTYQQVYKYEVGNNRISAVRLHDLARTLHVPMEFFFEDAAA